MRKEADHAHPGELREVVAFPLCYLITANHPRHIPDGSFKFVFPEK
jgi:hypothetical protein